MSTRLSLIAATMVLLCGTMAAQSAADSINAEKQAFLEAISKQIAGNEGKPAPEVFKNIKMMKEMTAGRLLSVMNFGYSRSLGVSCTHCHVPGKWESDEKPHKQVARDMAVMVGKINGDMLTGISNLRSSKPTINCTTCHRGQVQPALSLPPR
ncbi:MAG: c-type cytochrome [Bacteroidota bacterium]